MYFVILKILDKIRESEHRVHLQVRPPATLRSMMHFAVMVARFLLNTQQEIIYTQNSAQTVHQPLENRDFKS